MSSSDKLKLRHFGGVRINIDWWLTSDIGSAGPLAYDHKEFQNQTKPVNDHLDLCGIVPDTLIGYFFSTRLPELIQYCKTHPQYHIMSLLPNQVKVNRSVEAARLFILAEGDADPELWYSPPFDQKNFEDLEIYKFDCG